MWVLDQFIIAYILEVSTANDTTTNDMGYILYLRSSQISHLA